MFARKNEIGTPRNCLSKYYFKILAHKSKDYVRWFKMKLTNLKKNVNECTAEYYY